MWKRLKCFIRGHAAPMWVRNIYGDEIIEAGFHRSWWMCHECRAWWTERELQPAIRVDGKAMD